MPNRLKFDCGCSFEIIKEFEDGRTPLVKFSLDDVNYNCPAVWKILEQGLTAGVFQLESGLGKHYVKELKPTSLEHMSSLGALLRPGCLDSRDEKGISITQHYCNVKNGLEPIAPIHPIVDNVLKNSYNFIVYQEDFMKLSQEIADFNLIEVDKLRKCVSEDTMFVSKTRGWISIKELIDEGFVNDLFLTMDENGCQSWKEIEKIWYTGKKATFNIKVSNGFQIRTTGNHAVLTDSGWKAQNKLLKEDYILTVNKIDYDGKSEFNTNLALVIAGLITEGYFVDYARNATFVNYDKEMMDWFCNAYEKVFGYKPRTNKKYRVALIKKKDKEYISQWMKYGKSKDKEIPKEMMRLDKETTRNFLSFMLSAEGGVWKAGFEFSSKSKKLASQIQLLMLRFGINSRLHHTINKKYGIFYKVSVFNRNECLKLLYELSDYWSIDKKEKLKNVTLNKNNKNFTLDILPRSLLNKILQQFKLKKGSGSLYTAKTLSKSRIKKMIKPFKNYYWNKLLSGHQNYEKFEINDREKSTKVYDFTMKDQSVPYIIANGLVIHNSSGKKNQQEMSDIMKIFKDKAIKKGLLSAEQIDKLVNNIKATARYSFCKSHAMSYGIRGYQTAYIKSHWPLAFFVSKLKGARFKIDTDASLNELINEAKLFNIEVLCPDIRDKRPFFYTNGKQIKFGLSDIDGIGESTVKKLKETLKDVDFGSIDFLNFCLKIALPNISNSVMIRLIESGALDFFKISRTQMSAEYKALAEFNDNELNLLYEKLKTYNPLNIISLFKDVVKPKKEDGVCHSKKRVELLNSQRQLLENPIQSYYDNPVWVAHTEEKLLGYPVTCQKIDSCDVSLVNTTCKDFMMGKDDDFMILGVEIRSLMEKTIGRGKNAGQQFASFKLMDASCGVDAIAWPETWTQFKNVLTVGNSVIIQAERNFKKKDDTMIIKKVWQAK